MRTNTLYHTWFQWICELRSRQRINPMRTFVRLMIGIFQIHSMNLSRIAGEIPVPAKLLSIVHCLSRLVNYSKICVREWYESIARGMAGCTVPLYRRDPLDRRWHVDQLSRSITDPQPGLPPEGHSNHMDVGATCAWSQHGWQAIGTAKICPELVAKRGTRRGKESLEDCVRQAFLGCPPAFDLDPDPRVPRTGERSRLVQAPLYGLCFALAYFWLRSPPLH